MNKKISFILALAMTATMLAGCKKTDEPPVELPEVSSLSQMTTTTPEETTTTTTPVTEEDISDTAEPSVPTETEPTETTAEVTTAPIEETTTEATTTTAAAPAWNETEISETLYIKADCYSRANAIVGSDAVKKYTAGTKINIVAATDTGYYKLADGSFIHSDYVSEKAPEETTAVTTTAAKENPSDNNNTPQGTAKPISSSYKKSYTDRYPYKQLSSKEQELYKNIVKAAENFEKEVKVPNGFDRDDVNKVYMILFNNEPQLFWLSTSFPAYLAGTLQMNYTISRSEAEAVQEEIDATVSSLMKKVAGYSSTISRLKAIYDWVITNNDFSLQGSFETCSVYDSLTNGGQLQCQGYAKTFQYLCDVAGIESMVVNGNNTEGSTHAWNVVYCENGYYIVDTTWGDPTASYGKSSYVKYNFFLANDDMIKDTHLNPGAPVTNSGNQIVLYDAPACTKTSCYYFKAYKKEYSDLDSAVNGMYAEIDAAIAAGKNVAQIRVTSHDLWETLTSKDYWSKFQKYAKSKSSSVTGTTRQITNSEGCLVVHYDLVY